MKHRLTQLSKGKDNFRNQQVRKVNRSNGVKSLYLQIKIQYFKGVHFSTVVAVLKGFYLHLQFIQEYNVLASKGADIVAFFYTFLFFLFLITGLVLKL